MLAVITIMRNISNEPEISTGSAASFASVTAAGNISTSDLTASNSVSIGTFPMRMENQTLTFGTEGCGVSAFGDDVRLYATKDFSVGLSLYDYDTLTYDDAVIVNTATGVRFAKAVSMGNVSAVNGTFSGSIAAKSPSTVNAATYTVANGDVSLRFTTTNCTVTLPAPATFPGRILYLNTITANSVTSAGTNVIPLGSNTPGTVILAATAGKCAMLQSNGTNWIVMSAN